jgi:predicted transcriptional regulator
MIIMATKTTTEVAFELDTTPRTLRKFLRADAKLRDVPNPGKGARWSIEAREVRSLRSRFTKWEAAQEAAKAARDADAADTEVTEGDDEVTDSDD